VERRQRHDDQAATELHLIESNERTEPAHAEFKTNAYSGLQSESLAREDQIKNPVIWATPLQTLA